MAIATCYENAQKAVALAANGDVSAVEKALCGALARRFQASAADDLEILSRWDDDYADAMRTVYRDFPEDYDVAALTAEALMVRTPWKLWDLQNRVAAEGTDTLEAIEIVETALARIERNGDAPHPGLLHFYVHIMEMSPEPERAIPAADILRPLVPGSGHLIHMPSHIYVLCGQYEKTIAANIEAAGPAMDQVRSAESVREAVPEREEGPTPAEARPTEAAEEPPARGPTVDPSEPGRYAVQLGAFSSGDRARSLFGRAQEAGLDDYVKVKFQAEDLDASPARDVLKHLDGIGLPTYAILRPVTDARTAGAGD